MSLWAFRFLLWYICIMFVQPQNRFPFLWSLHIADVSIVLALACHFMAVTTEHRPLIRFGPATITAVLLLVFGTLSLYAGPLQTSTKWNSYSDILTKNALVLILVEAMAFSVERVRALITTMLLSSLWWLKGGLRLSFAGATYAGDRIMGPAVSLVENPNGFAYMMCLLIPVYLYFYQQSEKKYLKWFFLAAALAAVYIVFQTGSRTGMTILIILAFLLLPKYGARYKIAFFTIAVAVYILFSFVGGMNIERFKTIPQSMEAFFTGRMYEDDEMTQEMQSAQERRLKNRDTWRLIREYPLFGIGINPDESRFINRFSMAGGQVHCEILMAGKQMGLIGMTLYVAFLVILFGRGRQVQRLAASWWPAVADLGWTFKIQTFVFIIGGSFSPLPWNPFALILVGAASALWSNLRKAAAEMPATIDAPSETPAAAVVPRGVLKARR